jgi:hypothetical protein
MALGSSPGGEREEDIEAIFERLRADVLGQSANVLGSGEEASDNFSLAREEAERMWPVTAERPYLAAPGLLGQIRGVLLRPAKGVLRKLMRWYVEPPWIEQRRFNAAVLRLLDDLRAAQRQSREPRA